MAQPGGLGRTCSYLLPLEFLRIKTTRTCQLSRSQTPTYKCRALCNDLRAAHNTKLLQFSDVSHLIHVAIDTALHCSGMDIPRHIIEAHNFRGLALVRKN